MARPRLELERVQPLAERPPPYGVARPEERDATESDRRSEMRRPGVVAEVHVADGEDRGELGRALRGENRSSRASPGVDLVVLGGSDEHRGVAELTLPSLDHRAKAGRRPAFGSASTAGMDEEQRAIIHGSPKTSARFGPRALGNLERDAR